MNLRSDESGLRMRICSAIASRRIIQFYYGVEPRLRFCVVEPYCCGLLSDDVETLLCYQVSGHGETDVPVGWKLYRLSLMSELDVTGEGFVCRRSGPGHAPRHATFTTIYRQILPGKPEEAETEAAQSPPTAGIERPPSASPVSPTARPRGHDELMRRFRLGHWFFPSKGRT